MNLYSIVAVAVLLFYLLCFCVICYLIYLIIQALRKYIRTEDVRKEKSLVRKSLAEILKENRIRCKMTQEFVAEALGVSRQAVSKWENGTTDPSTSNLMALAKLYGVTAEEILRCTAGKGKEEEIEEEI
ncbi:helix-turn-helix domain-containing protein [Anaerotignum sp.]|uniref:helix-turn-helix domain-containing protein n=1 Tax=Anaerotignum sp. TaxID=2039241 RepID=UPI002A90E158|nr:helix-turn-helix transcriptional regulator [Anaerotignum sp.]MCI7656467.1 helix-turn-helix domain-containing protein [Clostridia bacterium]MDY5416220.1 helix-turn-helix transcriptional regulator [Anaerotignum sp.]